MTPPGNFSKIHPIWRSHLSLRNVNQRRGEGMHYRSEPCEWIYSLRQTVLMYLFELFNWICSWVFLATDKGSAGKWGEWASLSGRNWGRCRHCTGTLSSLSSSFLLLLRSATTTTLGMPDNTHKLLMGNILITKILKSNKMPVPITIDYEGHFE